MDAETIRSVFFELVTIQALLLEWYPSLLYILSYLSKMCKDFFHGIVKMLFAKLLKTLILF